MIDGEMIYRDFDHFTLPGTSVLYFALFKLFGIRAWIPQAMLVVVGTLIAWLSFGICEKLLKGPSTFLPGFLFLTLPFSGYLDATHHWYSTLAATAALAAVIDRRTPSRLAGAGALWGLGTWFAQSLALGPIGVALFLVWEARRRDEPRPWLLRKLAALFGSYLATVAVFVVFFVWKVGFHRFYYNTVVFVTKYYPADFFNTWRAYLSSKPSTHVWMDWPELPAWLLIHLLLPLVYVLLFVRYRREGRRHPDIAWDRLMLVNAVGLSMLMTVSSAAAYSRLYTVSLSALILLVWFLDQPFKTERFLLRGLWVLAVALAVLKPLVMQTRWKESLDLPTGRTAFFTPATYEKTKWMLQRTHPADYFFGDQFVGFALRLRNPGPVAFVRPTDYTRPEEVRDLVHGLEEHRVRFVTWYPGLDDGLEGFGSNNLASLRGELREHYRVAATFVNNDRIWERNP
jgi:hypothetical protein